MEMERDMVIDHGQEHSNWYGQLVARTWSDPAFKARLLADPAAALAEQGIALRTGQEVRVVENSDQVLCLTLPTKPAEELSDEQLDAVAGGDTVGTVGSLGTVSCPVGCIGSMGSAGSM
jgi:hypothetical protein